MGSRPAHARSRGCHRATSAMRKAGRHISDIETLRGGLDARGDTPINMPRLRAVARLGVAADRCRTCLSATHPYIVGDGLDQSAEHVVASQAEYEVDAILITPPHHLAPV